MSFGLFDVPVWFVWALDSALQQFAYLLSSHAFKVWKQGGELTVATDVLIRRLNLQILEISKRHLQLCATPLVEFEDPRWIS